VLLAFIILETLTFEEGNRFFLGGDMTEEENKFVYE
jgi:hypothetical protein